MVLELIGVLGLIILFLICTPTYYKWSYKQWYLRCERESILKGKNHDESTN